MIWANDSIKITHMQQNEKTALKLLANQIKNLRKNKLKLLNSFIFEKVLITTATLSRIENGLVYVKFTTLLKICQILDISLSKLLENINFPEFEDL